MKKTVIGLLALALVVGQLSGCSGDTQSIADSVSDSSTTSVADSVSTVEETVEATKDETVEATTVESVADTSQEETVIPPTTEETSGINEEELREHGKQWYEKCKDEVTCDEETFVNEFVMYVIGGAEEPEAVRDICLKYMKIVLQEPETVEPVEETPAQTTQPVEETKPAEETPVQTTKPAETTKPVEEAPKPAANDYSDIKWGDPIPDNMTNVYDEVAEMTKWVDKPGGKLIIINGGYYRSIQDWADGKSSLSGYEVDGITPEEAVEEVGIIEWN